MEVVNARSGEIRALKWQGGGEMMVQHVARNGEIQALEWQGGGEMVVQHVARNGEIWKL